MWTGKIFRVLTVVFIVGLSISGCSKGSSLVHQDIIGAWKAQNSDSTDVSIEFKEKSLIISSDLGVVENAIVEVKAKEVEEGKSVEYSIFYTDRGGKTASMVVIYSPEDGGTLRFKSDKAMVWKRTG